MENITESPVSETYQSAVDQSQINEEKFSNSQNEFTHYIDRPGSKKLVWTVIIASSLMLLALLLFYEKSTAKFGLFDYAASLSGTTESTEEIINYEADEKMEAPEVEDFSIVSSEVEEDDMENSPSLLATTTPSPTAASKIIPTTTPTPSISPTPISTANIDLNIEQVEIMQDTSNMPAGTLLNPYSDHPVFDKDEGIGVTFFKIRNNGHEDAKNVLVKVIVDQRTITTFNIGIIQKQESIYWPVNDIDYPEELGSHKAEFQVNPEKTIDETRYDNNSTVVNYQVSD